MRPQIQLMGGCASSFLNEEASGGKPESNNDGNKNTALESAVAGALLVELLTVVIRAVDASAGIVRVLSPEGLVLRTIGRAGLPSGTCQSEFAIDAGCGVCGKAAIDKQIKSSDVDYCMNLYGTEFFGDVCKFVLAVPLVSYDKDDGTSGVLTLFFSDKKNITGEIERTLKSYAELVCISLKNFWQHEDAHQVDLLAERQAIANEIHDSLAQTLYFAKMRSSLLLDAMKSDNDLLAYKCAQDIEESLESSQKTVRELVTHFRCQMDARGLKFSLQKLANDFLARTNIALEFNSKVEEFDLPSEYELQIFLIVREALVNIATHSGASIARLTVISDQGQYQFAVEDNGGGVAEGAPPEGHYGLAIMRERALRIGGEIYVDSLQGLGTRVHLIVNAPAA